MEQRLILRGFGSGALGGLLAFVFARILAEPVIQRATDYENGRDAAAASLRRAAGLTMLGHDHELFSRGVQGDAGLPVGMILFGVAMGSLVAVAHALVARGTGPPPRPRVVALLIAAAGFAGFFLLPFLKYPAEPPGIEHAQSIQTRGGLHLAMVAISVASVVAAGLAARRRSPRLGAWRATLVALVGLAVVQRRRVFEDGRRPHAPRSRLTKGRSTPSGNRTRISGSKGRRVSRYTMGAGRSMLAVRARSTAAARRRSRGSAR